MNKDDAKDTLKQPVQVENDAPPELTDDELAKVSGGVKARVRGGDNDLDDLEVER